MSSHWDGKRAWELAEAGRFPELLFRMEQSFGIDCRIDVEVYEDMLQPLARWDILGPRESHIAVGRRVGVEERINLNQRTFDTLPLVAAYHRECVQATGSVALSLEDWGLTPGLAFCSNNARQFLIPDPLFISTRGYEDVRRWYATNDIPWRDRIPAVFWRGHDFGPPVRDWRDLPRVRLCAIANEPPHSGFFDVGVSLHRGSLSFVEIQTSGLVRSAVPVRHFNRYRYHIDIDGRTNSWPGLFQKLLSGSPVLKVTSAGGYRQWYYDRLVPWQTFVPVAVDMSDLVEKAMWLRSHDEDARAIGAAGRALAESMTYDVELRGGAAVVTAAITAQHSVDADRDE